LRHINAGASLAAQTDCMIGFVRHQPTPSQHPDTAMVGMTEQLPASIAAAWPTGVSSLAIAFDGCQRREQVDLGRDWTAATH
jgi:hypothetical protein